MEPNHHARIDERLRQLHIAIARKLEENPALIEQVREQVALELKRCSPCVAPYFERWGALLLQPPEHLLKVLVSADEAATALRQSSPFYGILSEQERGEIMRRGSA